MPQRRPTAEPAATAAPGDTPAVVRAGDAGGLLETLRKSDLLPADRAEEVAARMGGWSPRAAGAELVREGLLTPYQVDRLRAGRYRGFFLDRYRLLAVLGAGGMGAVYVARDEGDGPTRGQKVAVKVLAEGLRDDPGMIARLRYEGVAGGRVDHPNVVKALRFTKADNGPGDYLLAMEFVEAVSAEELLVRGGAVKASAACDFARQTAAGLAACHAAGLIHRDVKPANLLVTAAGVCKVADFGLALLTDRAEGEFSLQMIFGHDCLGSADYMAPEQSRDSAAVDPRADVYSLGCTLYSLLTARVPYPGASSREVFRGHRKSPVPDARAKNPKVPADLAEYLKTLMAKDPAGRPATAAAVADRLETWAKRKPVRFDFEAILADRAKAAAKKEADRAARRAARRRALKSDGDSGSGGGPAAGSSAAQATRETKTNAALDTHRPDRPGHASSSLMPAAGGRSAADFAEQLLTGGRAGSTVGGRVGSAVGSRIGSAAGSRVGSRAGSSVAAGDFGARTDREIAAVPEPAPASHAPAIFPPTTLTPGRGRAVWFAEAVPIPAAEATVGRDAACDVPLDAAGVSGKHCRLRWDGRAWLVEDLASRNGTLLNDAPVVPADPVPVAPGDVLTLAGRHHLTLRYGRPGPPKGPRVLAALAAAALAAAGGAWWAFF